VLVASIYAFVNGTLESPYAMSKAGVEQLGRALRVELKHYGASASVAYFGFIDTKMVADAYEQPITQELDELTPLPLRKKLPPSAAAEAIVSGIERRKPRIIAPRRWGVLSTLRGVLGPAGDRAMLREETLQDVLARADRGARAS
jgi:short-subunit dehydrogenase